MTFAIQCIINKFGLFVFSCSACHVLESRYSFVRRFFIYYINAQLILLAHKMLAGSSDMFLGSYPSFLVSESR